MRTDGTVLRANGTFLEWTGFGHADLIGRPFPDLLTAGSRIFWEATFLPMLHLQGEVRDVAFDLRRVTGEPMPVLVSSRVVEDGDGRIVRVTVFGAASRQQHERELLDARRRAEASERRSREVALELQRSLLAGTIDAGPGFVVETRYRPAEEDLEVGGDWHDAFLLAGGGTVCVSLGDVVGRGIEAAGAMGQVRSALRAIAMAGAGPGVTLDQLDAFVERVPGAHCTTVVCAEVDLTRGVLRYARAGHLPPLLVSPDGSTVHLTGGGSTPLSSVPQPTPRREDEVRMSPGDRLLLYTDGLVERRDRGLDEGMAQLAEVVGELAGRPVDEMVDETVARLLQNETTRDDVCVLCLALEG